MEENKDNKLSYADEQILKKRVWRILSRSKTAEIAEEKIKALDTSSEKTDLEDLKVEYTADGRKNVSFKFKCKDISARI